MLDDEALISDGNFVQKVDELLATLTNFEIEGEVEVVKEDEAKKSSDKGRGLGALLKMGGPSISGEASSKKSKEDRTLDREVRRGNERKRLNFSDISRALRGLAGVINSRRIWLFIDEWSSVPQDLQPYLAEFLLRCVFPIQRFSVKIAAIEQQTNFMRSDDHGSVGLELGADVIATISLDDFLVYEGNEETSTNFFRELLFKHLTVAGSSELPAGFELNSDSDVIRFAFTDTRAFEELVRAAEGVPRDFLSIAGRAATKSVDNKISVDAVRESAGFWYTSDKVKALQSRDEARGLLTWIVEKVIREKC